MIKFHAIGGFSEVGKNMSVLEVGEDAVIFDMGLFMPPIVELENKKGEVYSEKNLRDIEALPRDKTISSDLRKKIRAILIGHAHLDHVGAVPYMEYNYKAQIVATPFTIEFLKAIAKDGNFILKNQTRTVSPNSHFIVKGKKDIKVEFVNVTHSTMQTAMIVVHTSKGAIVYANDFKFDNTPILGKRPNYARLKELAKDGVLALIVDSLYADTERKTPSEKIARGLLEDVLLTTSNENAGIFVTTFSSHMARLKSIVDCGKLLGRKVVFLGRSLHRYVSVASKLSLIPFMPDIKIVSYRNQVEKALKKVAKERNKWLVVCTGHQGEPGSILDRIARGVLPYKLSSKDHVVFASCVIPTVWSVANRQKLEKKMKESGVRIFTDVHVSGHCSREDLRDLIEMLQPKHIIPAHGGMDKTTPLAELASELGYKLGSDLHLMQDGMTLELT
ncbi:MAG: MBL fold metallo-hydrolase RNA specificity domain-containing protein [Candidatus Pacearchaeota archaeon]